MAFAETRAANPGALGLTIGLNVAAVLALAAWNPSFVKILTRTMTTIDVPAVPAPPQTTDPIKQQKGQVIGQPERKFETAGVIDDWHPDAIDPIKPFAGGGGGVGSGDGINVEPQPLLPVHNIVRRPPMMATPAGDLQPPYPPALQRAEMEGSVTVRILVGSDGRPKDIQLVRADDPGFFAAAKAWGMRHWRFKPAAEDDQTIDGWYTLTVKFDIE